MPHTHQPTHIVTHKVTYTHTHPHTHKERERGSWSQASCSAVKIINNSRDNPHVCQTDMTRKMLPKLGQKHLAEDAHIHMCTTTYTHTQIHIHIYTYIYTHADTHRQTARLLSNLNVAQPKQQQMIFWQPNNKRKNNNNSKRKKQQQEEEEQQQWQHTHLHKYFRLVFWGRTNLRF